MKKSIATVISVAGVLGAGAAAYAVNTSVLSATSSNDYVAAAPVDMFGADGLTATTLTGGQIASAGAPVLSPATVTPAASAVTVAAPATVAPLSSTPVPASTRTTYKVGTAGSVVLDTAGGTLSVVSLSPSAGWTASKVQSAPGIASVVFTSSTMKVEFTGTLVSGSVDVDVTSTAIQPPATSRPHHDDDDERDHDDEHDEDDHDEDDHDEEDD